MGLPFFKSVQREGLDGGKIQRAVKTKYIGDDFHEWAIFKVCMLEVIDTSIKGETTQPPIQIEETPLFKAGFSCVKFASSSDAISAFQIKRATLSKDFWQSWRRVEAEKAATHFCRQAWVTKPKSRLFRKRVQLCQKISDKVEDAWRSLPHPHYYLPLQFLYTSTFMARHTPKNAWLSFSAKNVAATTPLKHAQFSSTLENTYSTIDVSPKEDTRCLEYR